MSSVKEYRFGVIGCRHLHILGFIEQMIQLGHHCVGVYETENISYCKLVVERYGLKSFKSVKSLFNEHIDIIVCAEINARKIEVIELCESHQVHIMVDKPIITSYDQYLRLEKIIRRNNIEIGMMLTERFQPMFFTLKQLIDTKKFGNITNISIRKPHKLGKNRESWFFSKALSGGIIIDLLIHDFDLLRWLTGMRVTHLNGYLIKSILPEYDEFYDTVSMSALLDNVLPVQLYADWHTPDSNWTWGDGRVFITGTKGNAELRLQGDPFIQKQGLIFYGNHDESYKILDVQHPSLNLAKDFINRIEGKAHLITHQCILDATIDTLVADSQVMKISRI